MDVMQSGPAVLFYRKFPHGYCNTTHGYVGILVLGSLDQQWWIGGRARLIPVIGL